MSLGQAVGAHAGQERLLNGGQAEDGIVGRDPDVAGDGELEPAADAVPLQSCDDGFVHRLHRAEGVLGVVEELVGDLASGKLGQVQSRAEGPALAGEEDDLDLAVVLHLLGGGEHVLGPLVAHGVEDFWAVEPDLADRPALASLDACHGRGYRSQEDLRAQIGSFWWENVG